MALRFRSTQRPLRSFLPSARTFAAAPTSSAAFCLNQVRRFDFEHYLCVLLLPPAQHRAAFALRAFNVELAQVRDNVSDLNTGRMRLLFWRDTVEVLTGGRDGPVPRTPVASELALAVRAGRLPGDLLRAMIDARSDQLAERPFLTTAELETYGKATATSILRLQLHLAGLAGQADLAEAAEHLGAATALSGQLRAVPLLASRRGKCLLPLDAMASHGVLEDDVVRGQSSPELCALARAIGERAEALLGLCGAAVARAGCRRRAWAHFLPAVPARRYLRALEAANFDPLALRTMTGSSGLLPLQLWWARLCKRL